MLLILLIAIAILIIFIKKNIDYKSGSYYHVTKFPYLSVRCNIGRYGEYLTYKHLKSFESNGAKFLFNLYIPKKSGETAEIDVLMICHKGIFVFESKNYSGWIFGSENQKYWYQTLPTGKGKSHKEHFYNPIMQNNSHIKHLKAFLGKQVPMRSFIVFSDRCTLKNIQINSNNINVINRNKVFFVVSAICNQVHDNLLNDAEITDIYNELYPYTQADKIKKATHISNIQNNSAHQTSPKAATSVNNVTKAKIKPNTEKQYQAECYSTSPNDNIELKVKIQESKASENPKPQADQSNSTLKCPQCGANLVLRTALKGSNAGKQFYGCTNFPGCKYTRNLK